MRLGVVVVMLVIFLPVKQSAAQADSQGETHVSLSPAFDSKTELPNPPISSSSVPSVNSQENPPPFLPIGEDPDNRLATPFMKHLALDQKQFWTAPFHLDRQDAKLLVPFAAFTGALIAGDSWISRQVPTSQINRSKSISEYATYSLIGTAGASYLWGRFTHNDHL